MPVYVSVSVCACKWVQSFYFYVVHSLCFFNVCVCACTSVFIYPKMMDNMSPEELEQFKKQQAQMSNPAAMLKSMMGGGAAETKSSVAAAPARAKLQSQ
jgi:hypothetical protein